MHFFHRILLHMHIIEALTGVKYLGMEAEIYFQNSSVSQAFEL